jgi:transporter family-2 protein
MTLLPFGLFAVCLGIALTLQIGSNSILGRALDNPSLAAAINMVVGVVLSAGVVLVGRWPLPSAERIRAVPWWAWLLGGLLGTAYLNGYLYLAPRLGAAGLVSCIVAGQLTFAVIADHFGWIGLPQHNASMTRWLGCVLVVAGATLVLRKTA